MKVLAIDIGASSGRTIVIDHSDNKLTYEETSRFYHEIIYSDTGLSWNLDFIINSILEGVKESFKKYPDIASIGIDTWGVDYVYIDDNGDLVPGSYSYRDNRTAKSSEQVHQIIPFKELYAKTGIQFAQFNTIYQLYDDFANRKLKRTNKTLLMIPDYIAYVLTGNKRHEITNASTMGLLDSTTMKLSEEFLKRLDIPTNIFAPLINPGELIGYLKEDIVGKKVPVIATCSHDTADAVLGMPVDNKSIFVSSGTWSLVGAELPTYFNSEKSFKYNFANELGYNNTITFLKNTMGMFALNEVLKEWKAQGEPVKASELEGLINEAPKYEGCINFDDPIFFQPKNMIAKIDKYLEKTNQPKPVFKGQYADLIYQSLAIKYTQIKKQLEDTTGNTFDKFVISGGANQAKILNQYIANASGIKVTTGPVEATVTGNVITQLIALKDVKDVKEARAIVSNTIESKEFLPEDENVWKERYTKFAKLL